MSLSALYTKETTNLQLQLDVICCNFIYGCERSSLCAKRVGLIDINYGSRLGIVGRLGSVKVRVIAGLVVR